MLECSPIIGNDQNKFIKNYLAISSQIHIEGRVDEMKSSPIRRTFCLIVLFDLAACFFLWIMCVKFSNDSKFHEEVVHFTFNGSLFDSVVLATVRFSFLEILYGGIKSMSPLWIALSTGVSSAFAIVKMFMNSLPPTPNQHLHILNYVTILVTFVLCWTETIFFVCRVLPKERAAQQVFEYQQALHLDYFSDNRLLTSNYTGSENSNRMSPNSSDDEFHSLDGTRPSSPTQIRIKEMKRQAKDIQERAWEIIKNSIGWTYASGDAVQGCVTYKEIIPFKGKMFKVEAILNIPAHILYNDIVNNCEQSPTWNKHVRLVKKVESISGSIDILYNLSNEALRGYISPRDYVLLRTWAIIDQCYIISMASIVHDEYPPQPNIVRGEYGLGVIFLQSSFDDIDQCKCIWLMNNDIKGNLFKSVIDRAVPGILLEIIAGLRQHCETLRVSV